MNKIDIPSRLTVEDVRSILEITDRLKVDGQFGREGFQSQQYIFTLLNFFRNNKTDVLCIPSTTLTRFPGASEKTSKLRRTFCLGSGIMMIARSASIEEQRATTYRLKYQFKQGQSVDSFIEGLSMLYTEDKLKELYTKWIYKNHIANELQLVSKICDTPYNVQGVRV
jgi:hypothetical protein